MNLSRWDTTLEPATTSSRGRPPGPPHITRKLLAIRLGLRLAKGLSNAAGARIVLARGDHPFASVQDLSRRAGVQTGALTRLAEADAYGSLGLGRRDALWEIGGLRDEALPLFAAADAREGQLTPEVAETPVALVPMMTAHEVVEDYRSRGLSLRSHPVAFLRDDLTRRRVLPCAALARARNGQRVTVAGLVLVRQKPGSAKGVMFITIEDETEVANLVIWPSLFEQQRRLILSSGMIACRGRVQREGLVIHVVAEHLTDLSDRLRALGPGEADGPEPGDFPLRTGRGDEAKHGGSPDQRDSPPLGRKSRDIYIPDLRIGSGIKVPTREFR